jgi:hypothetical protein
MVNKVEEIGLKLNVEFSPSTAWKACLKNVLNLPVKKVNGESKCVEPEECEGWMETIAPCVMSKCAPKYLDTTNGCGWFFIMLPDKT